MSQTVITGVEGSVTMPTGHGGRIRAWSADLRMDANDATGFSSAGFREHIGGLKVAQGSASGYLTHGTTADVPGFGGLTTAAVAIVLTATTGCTFTFNGIITNIKVGVGVDGNDTIMFDFVSSGAITEAWTYIMPSIYENVGGQDVEFALLSLDHYQSLEETIRAAHNKQLKEQLDECGVKGTERFVALRSHSITLVPTALVWDLSGTADGIRRNLRKSLGAAGKTVEQADAVIGQLPVEDATDISLAVVGLKKRSKEVPPAEAEKKDPLP